MNQVLIGENVAATGNRQTALNHRKKKIEIKTMSDTDPFEKYAVVINHEEQYSIWPTELDVPDGWKTVGIDGPKDECLDHIEKVWTDMRPLSLRKTMREMEENPPKELLPSKGSLPPLKSLVDRLSDGEHPVKISIRPENTSEKLRECLEDIGYVYLLFPETRGGTELRVGVDKSNSDWQLVDFSAGTGTCHLEGILTLDFVRVRCIANFQIDTMEGTGHLDRA